MTPEDAAALPYRPCAGVMLMNREGLLFAGKRIDSDYNAWQMPQGGIEPGEAPERAALRELAEETGVTGDLVEVVARTAGWVRYDLPPELLGRLWGGRFRGQEQLWFLMRFLGRDDQVRLDPGAGAPAEFSEWAWVAPDRLAERIVAFKREVYARVLAEMRPHLAAPTGRA